MGKIHLMLEWDETKNEILSRFDEEGYQGLNYNGDTMLYSIMFKEGISYSFTQEQLKELNF